MNADKVLSNFRTDIHGLSRAEVELRRKTYGENAMPEAKQKTLPVIFLEQFKSSIIYILLVATVIVGAMGDYTDALVILAVLLINAIIGTFQEGKAQNTLAALTKFVTTHSLVRRTNEDMIVLDRELVPGDIIIIREGDKIPADARILEHESLSVDESALTGESAPIHKTHNPMTADNLSSAEQKNMVFRGTFAVGGHAVAVVTETGLETVIGGISKQVQSIDADMPIKKNIAHLSRFIIIATGIISVIIFILGILRGSTVSEMFSTVVAVAISIIPEGLPVVVTLILALGVHRMSKKNALVRRLQAVEALGHANIIAVDKTGTITLNQMVVKKLFTKDGLYDISGTGYDPAGMFTRDGGAVEPLTHSAIMLAGRISAYTAISTVVFSEESNEWRRLSGDPTEAALLVMSRKLGFSQDDLLRDHPRLAEVPFDFKLKYHASLHDAEGKRFFAIAGATDALIDRTSSYFQNNECLSMTNEVLEEWKSQAHTLMKQGLRVLALGFSESPIEGIDTDNLPPLCLVGLVGIEDDIRDEVPDAIIAAKQAGVRIVMITGDHRETAAAIGLQAGIFKEGDDVLTGTEMEELSEEELLKRLPHVSVFARVTPEHKLRIIELFKKRGDVIAMTGDGVNDTLSIAAADLGVSMGKIGTEVAKEASDIVLLDDNFGNIIFAIEEGRAIYETIKKIIIYLFSTSLAEVLVVLLALSLDIPIPFSPSQIIWLNFVTDGLLVLALAFESGNHRGLMRKSTRTRSAFFSPSSVLRMSFLAGVMAICTIGVYLWGLRFSPLQASTLALTVLAVFQWFNAWNCRSSTDPAWKSMFSNRYLMGGLVIVVLSQIAALYTPLGSILDTVPITLSQWGIVLGVGLVIILVEEIRKLAVRRPTPSF